MIWAVLLHFLVVARVTDGTCDKMAKSPETAFKSICYPYVGCFDNHPPFNNAMGDLPKSPEELDVQFRLHTLSNGQGSGTEYLDYRNATSVTSSNFDVTKSVKVIIHGFDNTGNAPWIKPMKDALLKRGDFNVIVIDWGKGATLPNYNQAVANLRLVGTQLKVLIDIMVGQGTDLSQVHIIGHSLGAHMGGYTGLLLGSGLGRITGMDPAEPDFECLPSLVRLDPGDAMFVDVIHTNGEPIGAGGAGLFQQCGHVDFYVNGGKTQPGCKDGLGGALSNLFSHGTSSVGDAISCSHARSHEIFTESINTHCPYTGFPCENYEKFTKGECMSCGTGGCNSVGYFADEFYSEGKFFLKTSDSPPFCGFHYAISIETSNTTSSTKGTLYVSLQGSTGSTKFAAITPKDTDLHKSETIKSVAVFNKDVGRVKSMLLKYNKYAGIGFGSFRFGQGKDSFSVGQAQVIAFSTGLGFQLGFGENKLNHDEEKMLTVGS